MDKTKLFFFLICFWSMFSELQGKAPCVAEIDYLSLLQGCDRLIITLRKNHGCMTTATVNAYHLYVDECPGSLFIFDGETFHTNQHKVGLPNNYCSSYCVLHLQDHLRDHNIIYWVFNRSRADYYVERIVDINGGMHIGCINVTGPCEHLQRYGAIPQYEVDTSGNDHKPCQMPPGSHICDTCFNTSDLVSQWCLNSAIIPETLHLKEFYNVAGHISPQCTHVVNSEGSQSAIIQLTYVTIFNSTNGNTVQQSKCPQPLQISPGGQISPTSTTGQISTTNKGSVLTDLSQKYIIAVQLVLGAAIVYSITNCQCLNTLLIFTSCIALTKGIQFGETDVILREDQTRIIAVERAAIDSTIPSIKVYVSTIEGYQQRTRTASGCNLTLADIGVNETQVDPAEDADFTLSEYELVFGAGYREAVFNFEVYNDEISEKEEILILYTNYTESPHDQCAVAVQILDNDRLVFNFSQENQLTVHEGSASLNLSIIKTGRNEPDVRVHLEIPFSQSVRGVDFDIVDHYTFDSNTVSQNVLLTVEDDFILEAPESLLLCITTRHTSDVSLMVVVVPHCVSIIIQDNEVATVGFKNSSQIMLQEGRSSALICVGIDDSMMNVVIDTQFYVVLDVNITANVDNPGTGHAPYFQPPSSFSISDFQREDCLDLYSHYDTDTDESQFILSLMISSDVSTGSVVISEAHGNIRVHIADVHGIRFISQPSVVTTGVGTDAHFECLYTGTTALPLWSITSRTGESQIISTTRLPLGHSHNSSGLTISNVAENQNMTLYSCLFQLFDRDGIAIVSSEPYTLIVMETITLSIHVQNCTPTAEHECSVIEGGSLPVVLITKVGYSPNIIVASLDIKKLTNESVANTDHDFQWCSLIGGATNCTVSLTGTLLMDCLRDDTMSEKVTVFRVKFHRNTLRTIEQSSTNHINASNEPLIIKVYDNDFMVGFTDENVTVTVENSTAQNFCLQLRVFNKDVSDIRNDTRLNLTVQSEEPRKEHNSIPVKNIQVDLHAMNNYTACVNPLAFVEDSVNFCDDQTIKLNVTATNILNSKDNIMFTRQRVLVTITYAGCKESGADLVAIITASTIIPLSVLLCLAACTCIIKLLKYCRIRKSGIEICDVQHMHVVTEV